MNGQNGGAWDVLQMVINLSGAFQGIFNLIIAVFALIGLFMFGQAMLDMYRMANPQSNMAMTRNPTASGITWRMIVSVILTGLVYMSVVVQNTLIGDTASGGMMNYQGAGPSEMQKAAWMAIQQLFMLAGYIFFGKGWMKLDEHFNGGQVSASGAVWQIIGSTLMIFIDVWLAKFSLWTGFDFTSFLLF